MKRFLRQLRASTFAREAAWVLFFNLFSRAIGVWGAGYAARCLGPANLGLSSVVLNFSQQALLAGNGGFDNVAVREIARDPARAGEITRTVTFFRIAAAAALGTAWFAAAFFLGPGWPLWIKWMGIPLLFLGAATIPFAFQGLERLPVQTLIGAATSLLTTGLYFAFFRLPMGAGSDLVVLVAAGAVGVALSAWFFVRATGQSPFGRVGWESIRALLRLSWRYWLIAAAIFVYISLQIPLIAHFLGVREAGIYRSVLMLTAGIDLVFLSANNLLIPRLVRWHREGMEVFVGKQFRLTGIYLWLAVGLALAAAAAAVPLYRFLFGAEYQEGIPLFRILVASRAVSFVGQIYTNALVVLHREGDFLAATLAGAAVSVALNLLCIPAFGLAGAAWTALATECVVIGLSVAAALRFYRKHRPTPL